MVENKFSSLEDPIKFFGKWAEIGKDEGMEKGHSESVKFMINKLLKNMKFQFKFLDVGCGNGWAVRMMNGMKRCTYSAGVDGAEKMIKKAKSIDPEGYYFLGDLLNWNPQEKFDIIHSMEVMYYFNEPGLILNKINDKWLKNNGKLIFGIDHYLENESTVNWPIECGVYMNTKSIDDWVKMVENAGYNNIKSFQYGSKENWSGTLIIYGEK